MLEILKDSGVALAFPDEQILASLKDWAKNEDSSCHRKAGATVAYDHLIRTGYLKPQDKVVLFNTFRDQVYRRDGRSAGLKRTN